MSHQIEILHTSFVTHDTTGFITTRPDGFDFEPGQGVEVTILEEGWKDEGRPFTPTSSPDDPVLEFIIKEYPDRDGVTHELHGLGAGQTLTMSEAFGTITYQGPGCFLAAGAGVTPFLGILRRLDDDDRARCELHFSNKTPADVICEKELRFMLGERCHLLTTREKAAGYDHRHIDADYLDERIETDQRFYLCGTPGFVDDLADALADRGVDEDDIVREQ